MDTTKGADETITLAAVGDVMLGDSPECLGQGVGSIMLKYGPDFPFRHVAHILRDADVVFANLESVVSGADGSLSSKEVQMPMDPVAISGLTYAGINVVSLANNHAMQHGEKGLRDTVALLKDSNVAIVGVEDRAADVGNRYIFTKGDMSVCLLGYNCRPPKYSKSPLYVRGDAARILRDVREAKEESEFVVLSLHWGEEFVEYPSPSQIEMGRRLIDGGADVIVGHHPHIIQGVERHENGLIAYSLGDFVFDLWQERFRKTVILKCSFARDRGLRFDIIPLRINEFHQPEPLADSGRRSRADELAELSSLIVSQGARDIFTAGDEYDAVVGRRLRQFRRESCYHYASHLWGGNSRAFWMSLLAAVLRRLYRIRDR